MSAPNPLPPAFAAHPCLSHVHLVSMQRPMRTRCGIILEPLPFPAPHGAWALGATLDEVIRHAGGPAPVFVGMCSMCQELAAFVKRDPEMLPAIAAQMTSDAPRSGLPPPPPPSPRGGRHLRAVVPPARAAVQSALEQFDALVQVFRAVLLDRQTMAPGLEAEILTGARAFAQKLRDVARELDSLAEDRPS